MDICELAITNYASLRRHPWEEARIQVIANKLKKETAAISKKEILVLDIGCGDAYVAYRLSLIFPRFRFLCVDTAFTPELRETLKNQISEKISLFATLDEALLQHKDKVDFVFLFDVIEHIDKDVEFLKMVHSNPLLSNDTKMFITVPAFQALFSNHDVFLKHYRRHTLVTLDKTIQSAGFKKIKDGYFFTILLIPRIIQKLVEKKTSEVKGIGDYAGSSIKTFVIKNVLLIDYHFFNLFTSLGIKNPGLSCFTICKKQAL